MCTVTSETYVYLSGLAVRSLERGGVGGGGEGGRRGRRGVSREEMRVRRGGVLRSGARIPSLGEELVDAEAHLTYHAAV